MNRHLDEAEIAAAVAGLELRPAARGHLEACLHCRQRVGMVRDAIVLRRAALEAEAPDWDAQRAGVLAALGQQESAARNRWRRGVLAAAAAAALAAGLAAVAPRPRPSVTASLPVERILAEVDATLDRDAVPGLEPLDVLVPAPAELEAMLEGGTS